MKNLKLGLILSSALALGVGCGEFPGLDTDGGTDAGTTDAGVTCTPACDADHYCDATGACVLKCGNGSCAADETCNLTTGVCEMGATCTASASQPSTCLYGQYCASTARCNDVPYPTCANFDTTLGGHALLWSPSTDTGPIIYNITSDTQDTTWCSGATPYNIRVDVQAYKSTGTWPSASSGVSGFFYVTVNGAETDATTLIRPTSGYVLSSDSKNATFKVNFCRAAAGSISIGMFFTGGNEYCYQTP